MQLFVASTWVGDTLSEINEPNSYEQQLQASAVMLKHTIQLLQARHDPQEVRAERQAMHFAVAAQLAENIGPANDLYRQAMHKKLKTHPDEWQKLQLHRATLSELTTTGLTSRYAGLEHLMVPALLHHDTSARGAINYDNLLVHMPPDAEPDYYRLQNKAGCIGACKRQAGKPGRLEKARSVYVPDIRLIAGHCDLTSFICAVARSNQAALSTSGNDCIAPDRGGHSISNWLLTICFTSRLAAIAQANTSLLDCLTELSSSASPAGTGKPSSSLNSR